MNPDLSFVSPLAGRIDLGWYTKDLLAEGHWEGRDFELEVDERFLNQLAANTNRVLKKGIDIPFMDGHSDSALAGQGFLRDAWVGFNSDGELTLWGLAEITGKEAVEKVDEGSLKNVSVGILHDFVDGEGEHFGPALDHVALTPFPVVHKQGGFNPAPEVLELDRAALPKTSKRGDREIIVMSRTGSSGVVEMAISNKAWSSVDKSKLPAACFLYVGDSSDPSTWKLPVYEGSGPLKEFGDSGKQVHFARGALNANAVHAAAAAIGGARGGVSLPADEKKRVAKRLLGLYTQIGKKPPDSLKSAAGVKTEASLSDFCFAVEVRGPSGMVQVESFKELVKLRTDEEERRTAWWAFQDYVEAIISSEMGTDEKKKELKAGIDDFVTTLDLSRHGVAIAMRRPGEGPQPKEAGMKDLLQKAAFKALCARLKIEIPEDAGEEFVESVLSKADAEFGTLATRVQELSQKPKEPEEPKPTPVATLAKENPEVANMAREVQELREERQKDRLSRATEAKDKALASGRLTKDGAEAFETLLAFDGEGKRLVLSKGAIGTETIDVRGLVQKIVDSLPDGAALDMEERTKRLGDLSVIKPAQKGERTDEDVEKTADEMVSLARQGTVVTGGRS